MPANLSPEYKAAEANFRKARDPQERLEWLREMLRVIPKHKGTDHLQGDIKSKIQELSEELEAHKKGGTRSGPASSRTRRALHSSRLIGPPNSGKSSLHARLTGSNAHVAPYPFTTQYPRAGDDAVPGHPLSARRSAGDLARASGGVDRRRCCRRPMGACWWSI